MHDEITIRIARAADPAVARLAALDSARPIAGPALVAERRGVPVAAIAYDGEAVVADPFAHSERAVAVLSERSAQLRGQRVAGRLRAWRRGERSARRRPAGRPSPVLRPRTASAVQSAALEVR
jgi:hypothetical protein